jgi:hypothetical protein
MPGVEAFNRTCQFLRFKPAFDVFVRKRYYFFASGQVFKGGVLLAPRAHFFRVSHAKKKHQDA